MFLHGCYKVLFMKTPRKTKYRWKNWAYNCKAVVQQISLSEQTKPACCHCWNPLSVIKSCFSLWQWVVFCLGTLRLAWQAEEQGQMFCSGNFQLDSWTCCVLWVTARNGIKLSVSFSKETWTACTIAGIAEIMCILWEKYSLCYL